MSGVANKKTRSQTLRKDHTMPATLTQPTTTPIAPPAIGLFEFTLEVADLAASERFYVDHLGLRVADRWGDDRPALWLAIGNEGFLGLWARQTGGEKAIHHGRGGAHVHFALRVPVGTLDTMQSHLESLGYEVESGWDFGKGNRAIYLDDPDGNVVELTERQTLWDGSPATE
jgi:catechol 2,3-dioxygenase-like lactoylglutathione lyase family enzyme